MVLGFEVSRESVGGGEIRVVEGMFEIEMDFGIWIGIWVLFVCSGSLLLCFFEIKFVWLESKGWGDDEKGKEEKRCEFYYFCCWRWWMEFFVLIEIK